MNNRSAGNDSGKDEARLHLAAIHGAGKSIGRVLLEDRICDAIEIFQRHADYIEILVTDVAMSPVNGCDLTVRV